MCLWSNYILYNKQKVFWGLEIYFRWGGALALQCVCVDVRGPLWGSQACLSTVCSEVQTQVIRLVQHKPFPAEPFITPAQISEFSMIMFSSPPSQVLHHTHNKYATENRMSNTELNWKRLSFNCHFFCWQHFILLVYSLSKNAPCYDKGKKISKIQENTKNKRFPLAYLVGLSNYIIYHHWSSIYHLSSISLSSFSSSIYPHQSSSIILLPTYLSMISINQLYLSPSIYHLLSVISIIIYISIICHHYQPTHHLSYLSIIYLSAMQYSN